LSTHQLAVSQVAGLSAHELVNLPKRLI